MKKQKRIKGNQTYLGFAWYKPDQWSLLLQVSSDRDDLEETYEEWLSHAENTFKKLSRGKGIHAEKVVVDVYELVQWCKDHNMAINGQSRSSYIAELLHRGHENTKGT